MNYRRSNLYTATALQLFMVLLIIWLSRYFFALYNGEELGAPSWTRIFAISMPGLIYDLCGLAWANAIFIAMRFMPFDFVKKPGYQKATAIIYFITNTLLLLLVIGDVPFFQEEGYRLDRDTMLTLFTTGSAWETLFRNITAHWWTFIAGAVTIVFMLLMAFGIHIDAYPATFENGWMTVAVRFTIFAIAIALTWFFMAAPGLPRSITSPDDNSSDPDKARYNDIMVSTPYSVIYHTGSRPLPPELPEPLPGAATAASAAIDKEHKKPVVIPFAPDTVKTAPPTEKPTPKN